MAQHLLAGAAYTRYLLMGAILLLVMRFAPKGLLPERRITPAATPHDSTPHAQKK